MQAWLRRDLLALRKERDSTVVFYPPRADYAAAQWQRPSVQQWLASVPAL